MHQTAVEAMLACPVVGTFDDRARIQVFTSNDPEMKKCKVLRKDVKILYTLFLPQNSSNH